jgi:hypothetical protein
MKSCIKCGEHKPLTEFYPLRPNRLQGPDKRTNLCKCCYREREQMKRRRLKDRKGADTAMPSPTNSTSPLPTVATTPSPAAASATDLERGLSDLRIRQLADWYEDRGYRHYSPAALAAGALDAELRAILAREVDPERVEVEFARVVGRP